MLVPQLVVKWGACTEWNRDEQGVWSSHFGRLRHLQNLSESKFCTSAEPKAATSREIRPCMHNHLNRVWGYAKFIHYKMVSQPHPRIHRGILYYYIILGICIYMYIGKLYVPYCYFILLYFIIFCFILIYVLNYIVSYYSLLFFYIL